MQIYNKLFQILTAGEFAVLATMVGGPHLGRQRLWTKIEAIGSLGDNSLNQEIDALVASLEVSTAWLRCKVSDQSAIEHTVMIEYFFPPEELIIFGGGHLAEALVNFAVPLNYKVVVIEDRPAFASQERFPQADKIICDNFRTVIPKLPLGAWSSVIIMTRGHQHDMAILEALIEKELGYLGMIGSRRRTAIIKEFFKEKGVSTEYINRVHMPIGLAIGARTPAEIAVSIAAELIKERYAKLERLKSPVFADAGITVMENGISDYTSQENIKLLKLIAAGQTGGVVLALVAHTKGSTPRKAGAKMLLLADGSAVGTIGGGCVEGEIRRQAYFVRAANTPQIVTYHLDNDMAAKEGMVCGGQMEILLLPVS